MVASPLSDCWSNERRFFELHGTLLDRSSKPFIGNNTVVQLSGPYGPAGFSTLADIKGGFRFKKVPAGMYILTAFVPQVARAKRTIEIGPSFADRKGRINMTLQMQPRPYRPGSYQVDAMQLSIPETARDEFAKGQQRFSTRDFSGAAGYFRRALDIAPQFSAAWFQLGLIACQEQRFQQAADHFREALKYSPENYMALLNLGGVLLAQRNAGEAAAVNERAVKARPDDAQAQAQLGYSYLLLGRLEEAETHLKRTVSLDPANYYYPQILLADIYSQRGDNASMVRELEEFLRLHPDSQKARDVAQILDRLRSQMKKTETVCP